MSFAEDLWDGFDVVSRLIANEIAMCAHVVNHLRRVAKAEEEHARLLTAVMHHFQDEIKQQEGSFGTQMASFMGLVRHAATEASTHQNLAKQIADQVCNPLEAAMPSIETTFKQLCAEASKNLTDYKASVAKLEKAKATFFRASRDLLDTPEISNKPEQVRKRSKLQQEVARFSHDYQQQVDETNAVQAKFIVENRRVMDELQKLDRATAELLPHFISKFFSIQEQIPPQMVSELESLRTLGALQAYSEDLEHFITKNRSTNPFPQLFEYETLKSSTEGLAPKKHGKTWLQKLHFHKSGIISAPHTRIFGVDLRELLQRDQQKMDLQSLRIPLFLIFLRDSILEAGATTSEGIFRISGNQIEINHYKNAFNNDEMIISSSVNVHTLCALLKLFFRELPAPLISVDIYNTCVRVEFIQAITADNVEDLVFCHFEDTAKDVLLFMLQFMVYLSKHYANTKMDIDNLAMVLAPCLIRCPAANPLEMLQRLDTEKAFLRVLMSVTPESTFETPAIATHVNHRGELESYDGKGFARFSDEEIEQLHSRKAALPEPVLVEAPSSPTPPPSSAPSSALSAFRRSSSGFFNLSGFQQSAKEKAATPPNPPPPFLASIKELTKVPAIDEKPISKSVKRLSLRPADFMGMVKSIISTSAPCLDAAVPLPAADGDGQQPAGGSTPTAAPALPRRRRASSTSSRRAAERPTQGGSEGATGSFSSSEHSTASSTGSGRPDETDATTAGATPSPRLVSSPSPAPSPSPPPITSSPSPQSGSPAAAEIGKEKEKEKEKEPPNSYRHEVKQMQAVMQCVRSGLSVLRQELQVQVSILHVLRASGFIITFRKLVSKQVEKHIGDDYTNFVEHHKPFRAVTPSSIQDAPEGFDTTQLYDNLNDDLAKINILIGYLGFKIAKIDNKTQLHTLKRSTREISRTWIDPLSSSPTDIMDADQKQQKRKSAHFKRVEPDQLLRVAMTVTTKIRDKLSGLQSELDSVAGQELDSARIAALSQKIKPLEYALKETRAFAQGNGLAYETIEPPAKKDDKADAFLAFSKHHLACLSAMLFALLAAVPAASSATSNSGMYMLGLLIVCQLQRIEQLVC
eukprot:TRINITY_DN272_c1_g4_i1.p1 TRINITY_DN272_c1_g4~~TRINITY_DN272_c1_g4_i1.p1  ORF type:complete len:1090 (+),score=277.72 TRINITY_DN272_c1_g4_i1:1264-4533(+)